MDRGPVGVGRIPLEGLGEAGGAPGRSIVLLFYTPPDGALGSFRPSILFCGPFEVL